MRSVNTWKQRGAVQGLSRTLALALIGALVVCVPTVALIVGPFIAATVVLTSRPIRLRMDWASWAAVTLAAWSLASVLWSDQTMVTVRGAATFGAGLVIFILLRSSVSTVEHLRAVAIGYLVGCIALFVRIAVLAATWTTRQTIYRLNLPDVNANYAGYAFALGFAMIILVFATGPRNRWWHIALVVGAVVLAAGIILADTRASFASPVILILWLVVSRFTKKPPLVTLTALIGIAAVAIVTGVADKASLVFESLLGRPTGDWSGRLTIWPVAREWWLGHLLTGTGMNTFARSDNHIIGPHNVLLDLGVDLGVVGVLLFLAILWFALSKPNEKSLVGAFIAVSALGYLTGVWESTPAAWAGLAVFSSLDRSWCWGFKTAQSP